MTSSKEKQRDAVVLDLSKAFDKVPHKQLHLKLNHYGVCGQFYSQERTFLCDRFQQVVVDGYCNASMLVISGVPQGSVLHGMNMLIGQYTRQIMLEAFCIIVLGIVLLMQ